MKPVDAVIILMAVLLCAWSVYFTKWGHNLYCRIVRKCRHKYVDQTVPFSDYEGGWHVCRKCGDRKYIRWGLFYQRYKELGMIAEDPKLEASLMRAFTGFPETESLNIMFPKIDPPKPIQHPTREEKLREK